MKNNILKLKQQHFNPFEVLILKSRRGLALSAPQCMKPRQGCPGRGEHPARQVSWGWEESRQVLLSPREETAAAAALFPRLTRTGAQPQRGGGSGHVLLPLLPQPCWEEQLENSWTQAGCRGGQGAPRGSRLRGTCLASNLSHTSTDAKYLPSAMHTDLGTAEEKLLPRKSPTGL